MTELESVKIHINGSPKSVAPGTSLLDLIASLGLTKQRVAIELNLTVIRRADWEGRKLAMGDRVEIVQFVGGG